MLAHRMVDQLQRFAEARSLPIGQRDLDGGAVVDDLLALGDHAADVDVVTDARHRLLVWNAVEALDDLRARGAEAEDEPATRHEVEACRGLAHARCRTRKHIQDASTDFDRVGLGGEIAHLRHRVEAVRLGHPDDVKASLFEFLNLCNVGVEVTGVADLHGELHGSDDT